MTWVFRFGIDVTCYVALAWSIVHLVNDLTYLSAGPLKLGYVALH